jgi:outer membrane murein-binding lipoprotein Lpp
LPRKRFVYFVAGVILISLLVALILVDLSNAQMIGNLEGKITGLNSTVNDLNTTVSGLDRTVNFLKANLDQLNGSLNGLESNVNALNTTVNNLENKVEALENKSWHSNGSFTLSSSNTFVTFSTQGEAWRMNYTFNGLNTTGILIGYNLRVHDVTGNIVAGLNGIELADLRNSGSGSLYVPEVGGTYSVEMRNITGSYTFAFEVESYY